MMEFVRVARQRIARIHGRGIDCSVRAQDGACIIVPQTRHVRSSMLA
jgi:hypothetical protein